MMTTLTPIDRPGETLILNGSQNLAKEFVEAARPDNKRLRWYALCRDESEYWALEGLREEIIERFDIESETLGEIKVFATYVGSPDVGVHICSMTPSAELWYIQSFAVCDPFLGEVEEEIREYIDEWIRDGDRETNEVDYHDMNAYPPGIKSAMEGHDQVRNIRWRFLGTTGNDYNEKDTDAAGELASMIEDERCNPSF